MKPEKPEGAIQRWLRIAITVWAYAYEYESESLVPDDVYDYASRLIDPKIKTGRRKLDNFFAKEFEPDTGMWIRKHPELIHVERLYKTIRVYKTKGEYVNFETLTAFQNFMAAKAAHLRAGSSDADDQPDCRGRRKGVRKPLS